MSHVSLRLLGKAGRYPRYSVRQPANLLICEPALVWGAALQTVALLPEEYSEAAVYRPEEVRLYASVVLSEEDPAEHGWLIVVPWTYAETISLPNGCSDLTEANVEQILAERASQLRDREMHSSKEPGFESFRERDGPYDLASTGNPEACLDLIGAVNVDDRLCVRGLAKLLSAQALSRTPWFLEEAALAAFISLEAALQLIRQHLEDERSKATSYDDAYDYLQSAFPTAVPLVEFLRDMHDVRNLIVHPSSRFGEFWAPPMTADDCLETIEWLVPLYRHILLGEVP